MCVFVFASLTTANRVKFLIKNRMGISSDTKKVPASKMTPGCSYGLFVKDINKEAVADFIKDLDVNLIGVFDESVIKGEINNGVS